MGVKSTEFPVKERPKIYFYNSTEEVLAPGMPTPPTVDRTCVPNFSIWTAMVLAEKLKWFIASVAQWSTRNTEGWIHGRIIHKSKKIVLAASSCVAQYYEDRTIGIWDSKPRYRVSILNSGTTRGSFMKWLVFDWFVYWTIGDWTHVYYIIKFIKYNM